MVPGMSTSHHQTVRRIGDIMIVARPARGSGLTQRHRERVCHKTIGHCWHPGGMIDWWCCECSAETDGTPPQNCIHCVEAP